MNPKHRLNAEERASRAWQRVEFVLRDRLTEYTRKGMNPREDPAEALGYRWRALEVKELLTLGEAEQTKQGADG